jgi:hypothetical protein
MEVKEEEEVLKEGTRQTEGGVRGRDCREEGVCEVARKAVRRHGGTAQQQVVV